MIVLIAWLGFLASLAFYKPERKSLRETSSIAFGERLRQIRGTLGLGSLLFLLAWLTLDAGRHYEISAFAAKAFGYSDMGFFSQHRFYQPLTSIFLHYNLIHLLGNLSTLMLFSAYERKVGTRRYLMVFLVSGLVSQVLEIGILQGLTGMQNNISMGASGAICGLLAGYFLDGEALNLKEWMLYLLTLMGLILFTSFTTQMKNNAGVPLQIDWLAHLLGALSAAGFVRLFPRRWPADARVSLETKVR